MSRSPLISTHSAVSVSDSSGGEMGCGGGRQPAKATLFSVRLADGTLAAITWPLNWPLESIVTFALGASTRPCHATDPLILKLVASGRFQATWAASRPDRFMYCSETVRSVSVVTLMSAVAPGWVRVMVTPGAWVSWEALTVKTLIPEALPVISSALVYGLTLTIPAAVPSALRSYREALSVRNDANSSSNENGTGPRCAAGVT